MVRRTERDCVYLTAGLVELDNDARLMLLFGLIFGEYVKLPGAYLWDIVEKFYRNGHAA